MKNVVKRTITLILVLCTLMSMAIPTFAAGKESVTVKTAAADTSNGNYYIVVKSSAEIKTKASDFGGIRGWLGKNSLVRVCGSEGKFYKIDMNGTVGYIKKDTVKKVNGQYGGGIYYTTKNAPLRPQPNEGKTTATLKKGTLIIVVGTVFNTKANTWMLVSYNGGIHYIYSKNIAQAEKVTMKISGASHDVDTRGTLQLKATVSPSAIKNVTWSSSDTNVATVDKNGLVTGVYAGNATITAAVNGIVSASWDVTVNRNVSLQVKPYYQTTSYTCSAASSLAVLRYYGKETQTKDTTLYKSINGYVGKINDVLNARLDNMYRWNTFRSVDEYENAVYNSLAQGSPVIARVAFCKGYFNYKSGGHYTTIVGIYKDEAGTTWVRLVDSYVNRFKSNNYTNAETGEVNVPLYELYSYGTYGGTSAVYLIYNP